MFVLPSVFHACKKAIPNWMKGMTQAVIDKFSKICHPVKHDVEEILSGNDVRESINTGLNGTYTYTSPKGRAFDVLVINNKIEEIVALDGETFSSQQKSAIQRAINSGKLDRLELKEKSFIFKGTDVDKNKPEAIAHNELSAQDVVSGINRVISSIMGKTEQIIDRSEDPSEAGVTEGFERVLEEASEVQKRDETLIKTYEELKSVEHIFWKDTSILSEKQYAVKKVIATFSRFMPELSQETGENLIELFRTNLKKTGFESINAEGSRQGLIQLLGFTDTILQESYTGNPFSLVREAEERNLEIQQVYEELQQSHHMFCGIIKSTEAEEIAAAKKVVRVLWKISPKAGFRKPWVKCDDNLLDKVILGLMESLKSTGYESVESEKTLKVLKNMLIYTRKIMSQPVSESKYTGPGVSVYA